MACEQAIRESGLQWSILRLAAVTPIHLKAQDPSILFEFSPDARMEFLHHRRRNGIGSGCRLLRRTIGKALYLAGGADCHTTYCEFANALMGTIGIGPVPIDAFLRSTPPRFFGDWLDTEESQRLLQFQTRGIDEQLRYEEGLRPDRANRPSRAPARDVIRGPQSPFLEENRRSERASNHLQL